MEFAAMKRKDLRELCRQHGLSTYGFKAELVARLASALSGAAAAAERVVTVAVAVGKGCLKQLGGRASGGTSGASKKVSFALDETSEARGRRRRSQVILSLVVAKTKGRRKARKQAPTAVSGRGRWRRHNYAGDSTHESVTREVDADAPLTRSRMKTTCLHDHNVAKSRNDPAEAEEGGEVVGAGTDRKRKRQENAKVITAKAQAGISRRITRSSSLSEAAVLLSPDVEKMRGGRKARNDKDELGGKEKGVELQDLTTAASPVECRRSSRRGDDCVPSVQKSSKVVVSCRTTRSSSVAATVMLPTLIGNKRRKTRGRPKAGEALPATALGGRTIQQKCDVVGDSVDPCAFGDVDTDALVTQPRTLAVNLHAESGVESPNILAEAEEEGRLIGAPTYRKRKQKIQKNAQAGVSHRSTRKSRSSTVSATAPPPIIAESISKMKGEDCIPSVQKSSKVVVLYRTPRSSSVAATVMFPTVVGNKRRKTRGRPKAGEALPTTALGGGASQQKCDVVGDSVDPCAFGDIGTDALVTQPRTGAVNLHAESGVESLNIPAEAEEEGGLIGAPTYRKRKQKIQKNAQAEVSHRSTRKSRSSTVSATAPPPIIAESVSKMKGEDCIPAVLKPAKVEVHGRSTRSRSVATAVLSPSVTRNKMRKAEDVNPNGELPTDLEVPPNDVPSTRTLRNRIVWVNNSMAEETHVGKKPEIKSKAKDAEIAHQLTRNTAKISMDDSSSLAEKDPGSTKRVKMHKKDNVARNGGGVSLSDDSGNKVSAAKTKLGDERTTGTHGIVSGVEFQNAKGGDVGKQPAVRGPVALRRSARKRVG